MPYDSLGEFLTALQDTGEIVRIAAPVDTAFEIAAITEHVTKRAGGGGPALLFSAVRNTSWPVVTNVLGAAQRLCRALGVESFDRISIQFSDIVGGLTSARQGANSFPASPAKFIRQAVCQQVVKLGRDITLWDLPALRNWPAEANPTFQGCLVITPDPEHGRSCLSLSPLQLVDRQRLLPYWTTIGHARATVLAAQKLQRQTPVALAFGGDPMLSIAAEMEAWLGRPVTYEMAGLLRGAAIEVARCRSHELEVPANSEVIVEGFIDADAPWEPLSGLGLSTGHYATETLVPPIQVTAITHRANPVLPAVVPAGNTGEESWRREAVDRLFLPHVRRLTAGLVDFVRPASGCGHTAVVSLRKSSPLQARTVAHALWSCPGLRFTKWITVVDDDVDVRRESEVAAAVARHVDPRRDLLSGDGPAHPDDHAAAIRGIGGRVAIDATRKWAEEGFPRDWPEPLRCSAETVQKLAARWSEFGLPERWGV